jgi:peptidyl-dipeptidase A
MAHLKYIFTFILPVLILLSSCTQKKPEITSKDELIVFLDSLEQRYETACTQMGLANWNSYSRQGNHDLDVAKAGFAKIFLDSSARKTIDEWRRKSSSLADKLLARRLELWHRCFMGGMIYADPEIASLENSLQQQITNYKFYYNGTTISRAKMYTLLREEKKQNKRRQIWSMPQKLSAEVSDDLIRLVKLRNEKANEMGFPNYYSLSLYLNAIDEEWLIKTLSSLEEQTRTDFEKIITTVKKKFRIKEFGPWDFDYVMRETATLPDKYFPSDSVFSVLHRFQKGIGFGIDSLPIKEVIMDIPYGGLSLAITIPTDSRFLVIPIKGKNFYSTAFHEYGHSLKAVCTDVGYPILKGYEWIPGAQCAAFDEGIANMNAEFVDDSLWLSFFTKAKPKEIRRYIDNFNIPALYRARRLLKDFFLEYEMYKNPEQDMAVLERKIIQKYLLVKLDSNERHQYAASIWYTSYPCYYQNYIMAGMIGTQLQEALTSKFGEEKITNPKVARWIIDHLYSTGETDEWTKRIRDATGKSLDTGPYLRKMGIETSRIITKQ